MTIHIVQTAAQHSLKLIKSILGTKTFYSLF